MRQITVYTTDDGYNDFLILAKNLRYVKKIETEEAATKEEIIENLKQGFKEMRLINEDKLKATPLKDFLNEL